MYYAVILIFISGTYAILNPKPSTWGLDFTYHDYHAMENFLHKTVEFYPDFASLYSIGRSVYGKELWVLKISSPTASPLGTPHVKLIGNIHGNEAAGKEVLLHFVQYLLGSYLEDEDAQLLLNYTILHILPSMNPDGLSYSREGDCSTGPGRENGNAVDLNRSFPDQYRKSSQPRQPETDAVIGWLQSQQFVLSASLHGGAVVANYPLDNTPDGGPSIMEFLEAMEENGTTGITLLTLLRDFAENGMRHDNEAAKTPDNDVFQHLASIYANNHLTMHRGAPCNNTPPFPGGITNGAAWYALTGGMQDFNYLQFGCMELTLEISCCKYPLAKHLPRIWRENKKALVEFLKEAYQGVRGLVLDALTGKPVSNVSLQVEGRNVPFSTSKQGEFWRVLLPGSYSLKVSSPGFVSQTLPFTVRRLPGENPPSTWIAVYLQPDMTGNVSFKTTSSLLFISSLLMVLFVA